MAFTLPDFNLLCDIYTGPWNTKVLRLSGVPCNLALGKRVTDVGIDNPFNSALAGVPKLLFPAGTDVRDGSVASGYDVVECPAGSGRWYAVATVDDIGKGFANEHRYAFLMKACSANGAFEFAGLVWPTPIP